MEVDRLEVIIEAEAKKASAELDKLIGKLNNVSDALNGLNTRGLEDLSRGIKNLSSAMQSMKGVGSTDFNRLANNITKLGKINSSDFFKIARALNNFVHSLLGVGAISENALKIGEVAKNISKLGSNSVLKAVYILPELSRALNDFITTLSRSPKVSKNIIDLANAMANLASHGSRYNSTIKGMTSAQNNLARSQKTVKNTTQSLTVSLTKLVAVYYALRRATSGMFKAIGRSMDYGETVNLFQTTFKKIGMETAQKVGLEWGSETADQFAKGFIYAAQDFNNMLVDALSLDPEMMMKYQAVFAQMSNSMGLTAISSMNLSDTLTMLGTDMASLWNIDLDVAMKKLQSGIAGQIRPLRELGIDISQTSLQMTALKYGIQDNISEMSQAAKVQLRYLAIMDQAKVSFGDMAKTIDSPANQLRILNQQWTNLSRSIGNVFLPIITTVLPYINAVVIAIRRMIDALATAMGYELPDYTDSNIYTDVTGEVLDLEEATDGATTATERLKKSLAGFDELNIITSGSNASTKKNQNNNGSGYGELDDAISNQTVSYMSKFNEEMAKMSNKAKELADMIQPKLEAFVEFLGKISPILEGIAVAFVTYKVITWFGNLATAIGALSTSPAGIIALAVGGLYMIYSAVKEYNEKLVKEDLASRFGKIALSMKEIDDIAKKLTTSKYSANIDVFVTEHAKLKEIEKRIENDIATLNKLNWKVSVGLKLTEGEVAEYKTAIQSFVKNSQEYIEQKQYVVNLALKATITNDDAFLKEMTTTANSYFNAARGKMEELGKKLRAETDKALADGILDAVEQETIWNLQKEMSEVIQKMADIKFKAKMKQIQMDYKDTQLTVESWQELTKRVQEFNQQSLDSLTEAELVGYETIYMKYDLLMDKAHTESERKKIEAQMENEIREYANNVSHTQATITMQGVDFTLDILLSNFQVELDKMAPTLQAKTTDIISKNVLDEISKMDPKMAMGTLTASVVEHYQNGLAMSGISEISKKALKEALKAFEPTEEQYKKIFDDHIISGKKVPEGVIAGLTDIQMLKAMTGDLDAIAFLMGQKFSTDPIYLNALAKCEKAGVDLNKNLIAGIKSKIPDLKRQGEDLVFDLEKSIQSASTTISKSVPNSAKNIIDAYGGTFKNDSSIIGYVKGMLGRVDDVISSHKLPPLTQFIQLKIDDSGIQGTGVSVVDFNNAGMVNPNANPPKQYATGGLPDMGEMFVAREAGPELVGRIGNRTAVANNDQIVQSVSQGVASAVANVLVPMLSGGSNVNVYLEGDAKGIFNVVKTENEAYKKSTGRNAFGY